MLEDYDNMLPYRLGFAVLFFSSMAVWDWIQHPHNPTRVREYGFLLLSMCLAVLYGVVHDHITATISPAYFLHAKGLAHSSLSYRRAVTWLAVKATYGPGALIGAILLIANNPKPGLPQLRYAELFRICSVCLTTAAVAAVMLGAVSRFVGHYTVLREIAIAHGAQDQPARFMLVWGLHCGSYCGAILGTVWGTVQVVRRRKAKRA